VLGLTSHYSPHQAGARNPCARAERPQVFSADQRSSGRAHRGGRHACLANERRGTQECVGGAGEGVQEKAAGDGDLEGMWSPCSCFPSSFIPEFRLLCEQAPLMPETFHSTPQLPRFHHSLTDRRHFATQTKNNIQVVQQ
jgi:hypothetical protein